MRRTLNRYIPSRYINKRPSVTVRMSPEIISGLIPLKKESKEAKGAIKKKDKEIIEDTVAEKKVVKPVEIKETVKEEVKETVVEDKVEPKETVVETETVKEEVKETVVEPAKEEKVVEDTPVRESAYAKRKKAKLENNN